MHLIIIKDQDRKATHFALVDTYDSELNDPETMQGVVREWLELNQPQVTYWEAETEDGIWLSSSEL